VLGVSHINWRVGPNVSRLYFFLELTVCLCMPFPSATIPFSTATNPLHCLFLEKDHWHIWGNAWQTETALSFAKMTVFCVLKKSMLRWVKLIKIHCKHICKCHNEAP
jgi:hypothetical protein